MVGYIHITGTEIPEDLELEEDVESAYGFNVECNCVLGSRLEAVEMVYNLGVAMQFERADWDVLQMLTEHRAGTQEFHYQIGGTEEVEDEGIT